MTDKQALQITVLWQQATDLMEQIQAALAGGEHNGAIQEIEAIKENLADTANRAVNGDGWHPGNIPFTGELTPDPVLNLEAWL